MSVPGAGLLAMLRRKTDADADTSKFAARSSAVHAIEQAVAAGETTEANKKSGKGRPVPIDKEDYTYDLDAPFPNEEQPALAVNPVTKVVFEYVQTQRRQVAVSDRFITYGLKPGHIRVLHRFSEARALLKGHTAPIEDIKFLDDELLAAGGPDGQLFVWKLSVIDGDNAIHVQQMLHIKLAHGGKSGRAMIASSDAPSLPLFFVASQGTVLAVRKVADGEPQVVDLSSSTPDSETVSVLHTFDNADTVTALSLSDDGKLLVAGTANGRLLHWTLPATDSAKQAAHDKVLSAGTPAGPSVVDVQVLSTSNNSKQGYVYVTGCHDNTDLELVHVSSSPQGLAAVATTLQHLNIVGGGGSYIHLEVVPEQQLLLLADTKRKAIYTMHWSGEGAACRIDYIAGFAVAIPVLNFTARWDPDAGDEGAVELTCVQTEAVQQYSLDPSMCWDEDAVTAAAPSLSVESASALPQPSPALANGEDGGRQAAAAVPTTTLEAQSRSDSYAPSTEECPSPPSTPVHTGIVLPTLSVPPIGEAPKPDSLPQPHVPTATTPRLLTPEDLIKGSAANSERASAAPSPQPAAAPASQQPVQILTRPTPAVEQAPSMPIVAAAAPVLDFSAAEVDDGVETRAAGPVSGDVAEVLNKELAGVHRKFAAHVSAMYREMLKALRTEMAQQAAAQQAATAALMREALAAQMAMVKEERAAVLAEERAGIDRLLTAISATLNRDLPAKLAEAVKGELSSVADSVAASVAPAVQQTIQAALPKDVSSAVKTALDKQLAAAVQSGLNKPLQDTFRNAFGKQLVPAFENACQSMFLQINTAFTQGFEEHLEASRGALAEPAALAQNLKEVLASLQNDQQLLRTSSLSSSAAVRSPTAADMRNELKRLLSQGQCEEAFGRALGMQDVATVSWLCAQTSAAELLSRDPPALSQTVLLSLVQQIAAGLAHGEVASKLQWIREAALALNPRDSMLAPHLRQVLQQVHAALQNILGRLSGSDASSCKLAMHVVHSQMTT